MPRGSCGSDKGLLVFVGTNPKWECDSDIDIVDINYVPGGYRALYSIPSKHYNQLFYNGLYLRLGRILQVATLNGYI